MLDTPPVLSYPWAKRRKEIIKFCPTAQPSLGNPPSILTEIQFGAGYTMGDQSRGVRTDVYQDGAPVGIPAHLLLYGTIVEVRLNRHRLPVMLVEHEKLGGRFFFIFGKEKYLQDYPAVPYAAAGVNWHQYYDDDLDSQKPGH